MGKGIRGIKGRILNKEVRAGLSRKAMFEDLEGGREPGSFLEKEHSVYGHYPVQRAWGRSTPGLLKEPHGILLFSVMKQVQKCPLMVLSLSQPASVHHSILEVFFFGFSHVAKIESILTRSQSSPRRKMEAASGAPGQSGNKGSSLRSELLPPTLPSTSSLGTS